MLPALVELFIEVSKATLFGVLEVWAFSDTTTKIEAVEEKADESNKTPKATKASSPIQKFD